MAWRSVPTRGAVRSPMPGANRADCQMFPGQTGSSPARNRWPGTGAGVVAGLAAEEDRRRSSGAILVGLHDGCQQHVVATVARVDHDDRLFLSQAPGFGVFLHEDNLVPALLSREDEVQRPVRN